MSFFKYLLVANSTDVSSTTESLLPGNPPDDDAILLGLAEEYSHTVATAAVLLPNDLVEINQRIQDIRAAIDLLYDYLKPQTITIHNFNDLRSSTAVTTVNDRLNSLFFDALIPSTWKIGVHWTEKTDQTNKIIVDSVTITMINHHVKERTTQLLKTFFAKAYNNTIYV
jgi:hypothetical protein